MFDLNSSLDLNPFQEVVPPVELAETNMQFGASLEIESELMLIGAPNDTNYAGSVFSMKEMESANTNLFQK